MCPSEESRCREMSTPMRTLNWIRTALTSQVGRGMAMGRGVQYEGGQDRQESILDRELESEDMVERGLIRIAYSLPLSCLSNRCPTCGMDVCFLLYQCRSLTDDTRQLVPVDWSS